MLSGYFSYKKKKTPNKLKSATTAHTFTKDAAGELIRNMVSWSEIFPCRCRRGPYIVTRMTVWYHAASTVAPGSRCIVQAQTAEPKQGKWHLLVFLVCFPRNVQLPQASSPTTSHSFQLIQNSTTPRWFVRASPVSNRRKRRSLHACGSSQAISFQNMPFVQSQAAGRLWWTITMLQARFSMLCSRQKEKEAI